MLERVDLKKRIDDAEYEAKKEELTRKLVNLQQQCIQEKVPAVICVDGWSAAGKGLAISKLVKDLDPRHFRVCPMDAPTEADKRRHFMVRYWERIGQYGTFTIFDKSWYTEAFRSLLIKRPKDAPSAKLSRKVAKNVSDYIVDKSDKPIADFAESASSMERQLLDDGYCIIKCFFHVSKKKQRKRLAKLMSSKLTSWRVDESDISQSENYDDYYKALDSLLEATSKGRSVWHIIAANDKRVCRIEFMEALCEELEAALKRHEDLKKHPIKFSKKEPLPASRFTLLEMPSVADTDRSLTLDEETYAKKLKKEQDKLSKNAQELYLRRIPMMLVFEGWDAAGKGGSIKRVASALDARDYRVVPSASPTPVEKEHPFLWRYWTNLPRSGHACIYDRSWYGRVMVERIEGFCTEAEWRRAFEEINEFEHEMVRAGTLVCKFWIDISQDEQLRRFEARKNDPDKAWKLTDEDWRNRDKYPQYLKAIDDMLTHTSTDFAPWTIVESEDKKYARIKVLKTVNKAIEKRLKEKD